MHACVCACACANCAADVTSGRCGGGVVAVRVVVEGASSGAANLEKESKALQAEALWAVSQCMHSCALRALLGLVGMEHLC